jgi:hypothetical protein
MAAKKKDKAPSTGLKKFLGQEAKMYEPTKKGSGKPKYQNVIKSQRVDTKEPRKEPIKNVSKVLKSLGTKTSKQEVTRKAGKSPNIAKQIDREEKVRKGVRTEKPSTKKVPVKPRGGSGMRGGLGSFGSGGGLRGSVNK